MTYVLSGASQRCQWCNEWEVSKTLPKLLQQREGNVSQLKQSSTVLHVSAWSQSSEIQQKPVLLVVLLSSSDAPSTVKTPWLTNAAFTASTTAFGGLPPGANPCPSWVSLSELQSHVPAAIPTELRGSLHCINFIQFHPA